MKLRAEHLPNIIQVICNRVRTSVRVELSMPTEHVPTSLPWPAPPPRPPVFLLLLQHCKVTQENKMFCGQNKLRNAVGYLPLFKIHDINQRVKSHVKNLFNTMFSKLI